MTIGLRIDPADLTVDPGREGVFTVHVVNQTGVVDRVALDVLGDAAAWSHLEPAAAALMPGTDATASLVVSPPPGTAHGPVPIGIRATSEASGFVEVGEANVNVGAAGAVEAELHPRTAAGKRRATSVVVLHNVGNAPARVQLAATDPDDAITFDASRVVEVGPGLTAEVPLRMRLPARERQGATLPYAVLVEGPETSQSLDGQVRQRAKQRWPLLAAVAVLGLLAAAFLMLKPQDAVALKDGAPDQPGAGATTTAPGGATTTVPGASTVPGQATADPAAAPGAEVPAATGTGGPPPVGTPTTTKAPPLDLGNPSDVPIPTTATTTTRAPACPPATSPEGAAQRVVCAWEAGRLSSVADAVTAEAAKELSALAPTRGQKVVGSPAPLAGGGFSVSFGGCAAGKGVASVRISTTAGPWRVDDVTPCP